MNVYINGRFLTQPVTGVQRVALELVRGWDRLLAEGAFGTVGAFGADEASGGPEAFGAQGAPGKGIRFTLLVPRGAGSLPELTRIATRQVGRLQGHAWEQLELPYHARDGLLVNLCNTGPLLKRRQIAAIHDTAVFDHPQSFTFLFRRAYRLIQRGIARRSRLVLTVSQFSKSRIVRHCRIDAGKIRVLALGREHVREWKADLGVYRKHGLTPQQYVLAVSSRNPYKNFEGLLRAVERLGPRHYEIAVVGAANGHVFRPPDMTGSERVKWLGYVSEGELKALYEGALGFVFPSFYEGFGLPPLEAMTCGAPVIAANAASIPEVCGDACLYVDPREPADIARQIGRLARDASLRRSLRDCGYRRAGAFSWQTCAEQSLALVLETLGAAAEPAGHPEPAAGPAEPAPERRRGLP